MKICWYGACVPRTHYLNMVLQPRHVIEKVSRKHSNLIVDSFYNNWIRPTEVRIFIRQIFYYVLAILKWILTYVYILSHILAIILHMRGLLRLRADQ